MNKYLFAFLLLFFASFMSRAYQTVKENDNHTISKNDTTYYSIDGDKTEWDYADYYRVIYANPTDAGYKMEERYIVRNRLKLSAYVIDLNDYGFKFNGPYKSFDNKGYKIGEGVYDHGYLTGIDKQYYPGTDTLWYQTIHGKDGYTLTSYYRDGKIKRRQDSLVGHNVDGICYDENGKEIPFTSFVSIPVPSVDLHSFLKHNLHYPPGAYEGGVQGRVVLKFVVLKDGTISKAHAIRSLSKECDAEAVRVLYLMPKWKPGITDDEPVDVYFTLPIRFQLDD